MVVKATSFAFLIRSEKKKEGGRGVILTLYLYPKVKEHCSRHLDRNVRLLTNES